MQACPGYVLHHQLVFFITEKCRNYSGILPEPKLKNWKTVFSREIQEEILHMDSVFQFFSFGSGTIWKTETLDAYKQIVVLASMSWLCTSSSASFFHYGKVPELFRNTSGTKTEKLKNCFFQRDPGRDSPYGFSFSVFQFPELFRNISGETEKLKNWKTKKLKNWKTESIWRISSWISLEKTVFQFFSFSVFQFPELFRNISGETEKLKNWIFQGHAGRGSPYGFRFSVF